MEKVFDIEVNSTAMSIAPGTWSTDGHIYFAPTNISSIWKVPETGGTPTEVTKLDRGQGEVSHRFPQFVQNTLIFTVWTGPGYDEKSVAVQSVSSADHRVVVHGGESGRYVTPGYLVYARMDDLLMPTYFTEI